MSEPHDARHEELLAAMAAGERAADEPDAAQLLRGCPTCRADLTALREAARHVEKAGAAMRATVAESREIGSAPGLERVAPTLERLAAERGAARRPRRGPWLAAAALFLVLGPLVAYLLWTRGDAPVEPLMLGPNQLQLLEPIGEVRDYERFVWKYSGEPNGFVLRIFDEGAGADAQPLRVPCEESIWVPDAEARAKLPDHVRWEVDALDAFRKDPVASQHASAQRSSR